MMSAGSSSGGQHQHWTATGSGRQETRRGTVFSWRVPLMATGMVSMACGTWLGLVRLGWRLPLPFPDRLIAHGPLMVCGFLGTLITLERAVALGRRWAYTAPALVAAGALMLDLPVGSAAPFFVVAGSAVLVAIFLVLRRRQPALFTATMTAGAVAWLVGNSRWLAGWPLFRARGSWPLARVGRSGERARARPVPDQHRTIDPARPPQPPVSA